ncbi:MAG: hypothetical protein AB1757_26810 [Acidobacteriota bacterium]
MDITITIEPEVQAKLQQRAQSLGQDIKEFVESVVKQEALKPVKSVDEILAPVRQEFAESGMTEDELDDFLNDVREKAWQEKPAKDNAQ